MPSRLSIEAQRRMDEMKGFVNERPIVISRYLLLTGDGFSTANSWSYAGDFRALEEPVDRSTWFALITDARSTKQIYKFTVPVSGINGPAPASGQRLIAKDANGIDLGTYLINFVEQFRAQGYTYAYGIVCEVSQ